MKLNALCIYKLLKLISPAMFLAFLQRILISLSLLKISIIVAELLREYSRQLSAAVASDLFTRRRLFRLGSYENGYVYWRRKP